MDAFLYEFEKAVEVHQDGKREPQIDSLEDGGLESLQSGYLLRCLPLVEVFVHDESGRWVDLRQDILAYHCAS